MPFGHLGGLNFANLGTCGHSYKIKLEQIVGGVVSILFVAGLLYYILFHGFIHDWIVRIWKMIQLIIN